MKKIFLILSLFITVFVYGQSPVSPVGPITTNTVYYEPSTGIFWTFHGSAYGYQTGLPPLTGSTGLYLKSTGTGVIWAAASSGTPTLQQVTTAGNTTTLGISAASFTSTATDGSGGIFIPKQMSAFINPPVGYRSISVDQDAHLTVLYNKLGVINGYKLINQEPTGTITVKLPFSATAILADSNQSAALYVPQTRTLTINGTTLDLSANRSWTVSGTTTNALTLAASGGASAGATFNGSAAITADYHTLGAQQALTLTTIGTSGAATLSGPTLNIPQYSSGISLLFPFTPTATAGATTTLTATSTYQQYFTGTLNQTVTLPVAATLTNGQQFLLQNNSTGQITVVTSGGITLQVLDVGATAYITCANSSGGTGIASWYVNYYPINNYVSGTWTGAGTSANPFSITTYTTPTVGRPIGWDGNLNISANNIILGYNTIATAAGTTTLTASSASHQYFTGTTTQTVVMPAVSTLVLGESFQITNKSTGNITVQSSGGNTIATLSGNSQYVFTVILTTGTTAASWSPVSSSGLAIGAFSSSSQANGATATLGTLTFGPADQTNPGMVKASGAQTFGGVYSFNPASGVAVKTAIKLTDGSTTRFNAGGSGFNITADIFKIGYNTTDDTAPSASYPNLDFAFNPGAGPHMYFSTGSANSNIGYKFSDTNGALAFNYSVNITPALSALGGDNLVIGKSSNETSTVTPGMKFFFNTTNAAVIGQSPVDNPVAVLDLQSTTKGFQMPTQTTTQILAMGVVSKITGLTGSGYTVAPTLSFSGGGGTGATATCSISGGTLVYTVTNGGSGYTSDPTLIYTGGSTGGVTATASVSISLDGHDGLLAYNSTLHSPTWYNSASLAFVTPVFSASSADLTAQTTAGNITTFTVGSSTTTFNVSLYINITAISVDVIQGQITYTDENNTSQTVSLANLPSAIGNSAYSPTTIRAKNGTVITVKTNLTTGAGTITFDAGARIEQL